MIKKTQNKEEGIVCKKDVEVSYPKKKNSGWLSYFVELILVIVISWTTVGSFISGCTIEIDQKVYLYGIILLSTLFYTSFLNKKWGEILLIGEVAAYGTAGYFFRNEISDGLALVVNTLFLEIENYFGIELAEYQVNSQDTVRTTTIFIIYISVLLVGFIAYIIRNELPIILLLFVTIWIAFIPEMVGFVPAFGYRLGYAAGLFVYGGSGLYKRKTTEKKFAAQKRIQEKIRLIQVISVGIWIGIFTLILGEGTYKELTKDKSFKVALQENIRRGMDNLIRGTFCQGSVSGGISFGELGEVEGIEYTGDTKLKLRLEKKEFEPVYLRGYIGSYYQDNAWLGLTKEDEEKKQHLETMGDIKVEDYDAAFLYYYLALLKYNSYMGRVYEDSGEKGVTGFPAYQGTEKAELIRDLFPESLGKIQIDNIAETYGTLFTPYYCSGNILEKNGKLSVEGKKNLSYYEWDVVEEGKRVADFIINREGYDSNNQIFQYFPVDVEAMINDVEKRLGRKLEEYPTEHMERVTVREFFHISESDELEIEDEEDFETAKVIFQIENYADADAGTMLELLKNFKVYRNYQQQYENYVEQTYLQVPEELKIRLLDTLNNAKDTWRFRNDIQMEWLEGVDAYGRFGGGTEWIRMISNLLLVKQYLKTNTDYTLTPGAVPEGEDFVTHFLYENKKGFCTHYASAAVLMLRSLGIPARYVEGYMAGSTDLKLGKYENDYLSVELTDENAHAWAEIYIHDYGWVPVEMTPGYSEGFEIKEITEKETTTPNATDTPQQPQTTTSPTTKTPVKVTLPIIKKIKAMIQKIVLVLLVFFGIWVRRFILCQYRKHKEIQQDFGKCIIFLYKEIDRILCIKKHKKKDEELREWLQREKEDMTEGIAKEQWEQLLIISNRCAFSGKPPLLDDVEKAREIYHALQENSYKSSSIAKRIFYRYVRVM